MERRNEDTVEMPRGKANFFSPCLNFFLKQAIHGTYLRVNVSVRQKTTVLTELAFVFNLPEREVGPYGHENVFPAV